MAMLFLATALVFLFINPWAEKKLKAEVQKQSQGLYQLQTGAVDVSLLGGSLTIDSFRLKPKVGVWEKLENQNPAKTAAMVTRVAASQIKIEGLSYMSLLLSKPLHFRNLTLENPQVEVRQMKEDTAKQKPLHRKLTGRFKGLAIKNIEVKKGTFQFYKSAEREKADVLVEGVDARFQNFKADSSAFQDKSRSFYCSHILAETKKLDLALPKGYYRIKTGSVRVDTRQQEVSIANGRLVPQLTASALARKAGRATARFVIQVPQLRFSKVDFSTFSRYGNVAIGSVTASNPDLKAYMDCKNFAIRGTQPLPHDLVQSLPFGLNIRQVAIKSLKVRYEELAPNATKTGFVTGTNIHARIRNLTNDKRLMTRNSPAVLNASGYIMGKAYMAGTVRLNLLDPSGAHTLEGRIGKGNPAVLNQMLEPILGVSVKSGVLEKGTFTVRLNKASASGSMLVQYDDFKIDLLSKKQEKRQSLGKKILSFAANKLVIDSDSPSNGKEPKQVPIQVQRRPDRSVLTYWKDCLANGVMTAIWVAK
ncbi:MAG: hypothetical protein ACO1OQ_09405 [Rufibacter sp.]